MPRLLRFFSALLLASLPCIGAACAKGTQLETAGGEGGSGGGQGQSGSPAGSTASSGAGMGGASTASSSSSGGGASATSSATTSSASGSSSSSGGGGGPVTFMVVRVGEGAPAVLSGDAAPIFLEERGLDGTMVAKPNNPLPLPTTVNGNNQPITLSGLAGSEGGLSLSDNGKYVTIGGYAATVGAAAVNLSLTANVNRVIGRIDASGNVDTSTRFNTAFNGSNIRGATTSDGTAFWAGGNGLSMTGGIQYIPLGVVGGTRILAAPNNARWPHVVAGQLYASSGAAANPNVFTVGVGLPTTTGQVGTALPGLPAAGASPYSFALFDRDPNVPGMDTLYIADDSAKPTGGVQKWTFNGISWIKAATFNQGITTGARGLAGVVTGNDITLIATTAEALQNHVVVYVDDGTPSPMGVVVATAGLNTVFRGVAIAPK